MILHRISLQFFSICFVLSGKLIKMLGGSVKLRGQHTRCVGGNVAGSGWCWLEGLQVGRGGRKWHKGGGSALLQLIVGGQTMQLLPTNLTSLISVFIAQHVAHIYVIVL